jgi:ankyrin repeat protein
LGAKVALRPQAGVTPLMIAAEKGHTAIMEDLLNAGADVNAADAEGRTALHRAAAGGASDAARSAAPNAAV